MAISGKEYLELIEAGKEPFSWPQKPKCSIDECKQHATHPSPKGEVCEDCYFDLLGAEIDKHPIGRPTPHGGCV